MPTEAVPSAAPFVPEHADLLALARAVQSCRGCDLWRPATQAVFGEGPRRAPLLLVGEQPGDKEDVAGRPFVGPAGHVLDDALAAAGIDRDLVYLTNAVKHFKHEQRGKRRIHARPNRTEIVACRPWLDAEVARVDPTVIVLLGVVAGESLVQKGYTLKLRRGTPWQADDRWWVATIHPSAVLRGSPDDRAALRDGLVADLRAAAALLAPSP